MSGPDSSGRRIDAFDVVAFDADDTLWRSEDSFAHAEQRFSELVGPYVPTGVDLDAALRATEKADLLDLRVRRQGVHAVDGPRRDRRHRGRRAQLRRR